MRGCDDGSFGGRRWQPGSPGCCRRLPLHVDDAGRHAAGYHPYPCTRPAPPGAGLSSRTSPRTAAPSKRITSPAPRVLARAESNGVDEQHARMRVLRGDTGASTFARTLLTSLACGPYVQGPVPLLAVTWRGHAPRGEGTR